MKELLTVQALSYCVIAREIELLFLAAYPQSLGVRTWQHAQKYLQMFSSQSPSFFCKGFLKTVGPNTT